MKREALDWLADNPFYTKRFAFYVGRRCRDTTITALAQELALDWKTVKELDKQYMGEQVRRIGCPAPLVNVRQNQPSKEEIKLRLNRLAPVGRRVEPQI